MSRPGLMKIRCAPAYNAALPNQTYNINVDRANNVIRNVSIMQAGVEALGHGVMSDETTVRQAMLLGNQPRRGIQGHLGHPGMSENASGRQFFTSRNFRVAGALLLADLHMFEPARRSPVFTYDPVEWMMAMAEQHPDQLAMSAVIGMRAVWVMEDGSEEVANVDEFGDSEEPPYGATTPLPVIRVEAFYNADVVEEGALTRAGLFSADTPAYYTQELFTLLDEWRTAFGIPLEDVPRKAHQFMSKYMYSRGKDIMGNSRELNSKQTSADIPVKAMFEEQPSTVPAPDADAPVSTPEPTSTPPAEAPEADPIAGIDADLAEAEALLDEDGQEDEGGEVSAGDTEETSFAALHRRVSTLEQQLAASQQDNATLAGIMARQSQVISKLTKRVMALENEEVITERIGGARTLAAARSTVAGASRPVHVSQRPTQQGETPALISDFESDPEQATLMAVVTRQRAITPTSE